MCAHLLAPQLKLKEITTNLPAVTQIITINRSNLLEMVIVELFAEFCVNS